MTVETIAKLDLTLNEWLEIASICEVLRDGLIELYCSKKRPEQQWKFDFSKNFWYNIYVERKPTKEAISQGGGPPHTTLAALLQILKIFEIFGRKR